MKTNKIFTGFIGFATFAFALSLNYRYALNDYGVLENTLSTHVLAQSSNGNGGGGGSSSGVKKALPYENVKGRNDHCILWWGGGWTASVKWVCYCPYDGEFSSCYEKPCGYGVD